MYRHLYSGLRTGHEQNRYEWRRSLPEVGEDWVLEVMTSRRHVINCQWQGPHTPLAETARQRGRHCQRSDARKSTPRSLRQRGVTGLRGCGQYSGTGGCKESKGFFFFLGGGGIDWLIGQLWERAVGVRPGMAGAAHRSATQQLSRKQGSCRPHTPASARAPR